jgi:hypothetical protein
MEGKNVHLIFTLRIFLEMQINLRTGLNKCGRCSETLSGASFFFFLGDYGGEMCYEMRGCELGVFSNKGLDVADRAEIQIHEPEFVIQKQASTVTVLSAAEA